MYHHDHRCVAIFISNRNHPHFAVAKLRAQPHQNIPPVRPANSGRKNAREYQPSHSQTNTSEKYLMYTMGLQNPGWTSKVQNMWIKKMTVPLSIHPSVVTLLQCWSWVHGDRHPKSIIRDDHQLGLHTHIYISGIYIYNIKHINTQVLT